MTHSSEIYELVGAKILELETALRRLHRWDEKSLPPEKFEDMGAFGANTMTFEQWLQFVLIPRIQEIIADKDEFPTGSMLAPYAIRVLDGDPDGYELHDILYALDALVNGESHEDEVASLDEPPTPSPNTSRDTVELESSTIPQVLFTLAGVLPQFEGEDLESQLQTFDMFLSILSPDVRPTIADLLNQAAQKSENPVSKARIEKAVKSVSQGGSASA